MVKLAGLAKVIVIAGRFGTGDALDAFLIAFLVPSFVADSLAGSVSASLVPALIDERERNGEAADRLFSSVTWAALAVLVLIAGLIVCGGHLLVAVLARGFSREKLALANSLLLMLAPAAVLGGMAAVWKAVLNAGERFAVAAMSPLMTPLAIIVALLLSGKGATVRELALGTNAGCFLEVIVLAIGLRAHGFKLRLRWYGIDPALVEVFRHYLPVVASTIVMGASLLVNQSLAAALGPGSVAAFAFGTRLATLASGSAASIVSTAVFPHFSRMATHQAWRELRRALRMSAGLLIVCSVPLTIGLSVYSEPLVRLLLQRGAFAASDTNLVAAVQRLALLQIPFYVLAAPLVRMVSALKANRTLLSGAALHLSVNAVLDFVLMRWLGVAGIGLAVSITAAIYLCYLISVVSMQMRAVESRAGMLDLAPQTGSQIPSPSG